MLDNKKNKGKHLTIHDRTFIEDALTAGHSLRDIAERLDKDTTTISKEIKKNRILKVCKREFLGGCINRSKCRKKHLCNDDCKIHCKKCTTLNCYIFLCEKNDFISRFSSIIHGLMLFS